NRGSNLRDELVTYWQEQQTAFVTPKPGRMAFAGDGAECSAGAKIDAHTGVP
ncbi:MAG: hypothetical protein JNG84_04110, partial [Archangium sp.]|nr:hypothetical protein [Archangium sp.]